MKEFARLKAETDGGIAVETVINLRGAVYLSGGSMRGGRKEVVLSDYAALRERKKSEKCSLKIYFKQYRAWESDRERAMVT